MIGIQYQTEIQTCGLIKELVAKKKQCHRLSLWRNRLARSTVNRKVGGSSPPKDVGFLFEN